MFKYFKNIFKNDKKILLGRWGYYGTDIKNIYANHDHCGDIICKNPIKIKEYIKNNKNNKSILKINK